MSWICVECNEDTNSGVPSEKLCSSCHNKLKEPGAYQCECGRWESLRRWRTGTIAHHGKCFYCNFWETRIREADERTVVIDGHRYEVDLKNPMSPPRPFLGFAGRVFTIRFHDGREVTTNNLWTQGEIPERFRERIPDNAEFVRQ